MLLFFLYLSTITAAPWRSYLYAGLTMLEGSMKTVKTTEQALSRRTGNIEEWNNDTYLSTLIASLSNDRQVWDREELVWNYIEPDSK